MKTGRKIVLFIFYIVLILVIYKQKNNYTKLTKIISEKDVIISEQEHDIRLLQNQNEIYLEYLNKCWSTEDSANINSIINSKFYQP